MDYIDQGYKFVYYDGTNTGFCSSYTMAIKLGEAKDFEVNMKKVNIE